MSDNSWREEIAPMVRSSQIVLSALITGSVVFLTVACVLVVRGVIDGGDDVRLFAMNLTLVLFLIVDLIARMVVPSLIVARARRQIAAGQWLPPAGPGTVNLAPFLERTGDAGRLMCVYQVRTIVAAALLEGLAFFAIIVFVLPQSIVGLTIAIVMIFGLMLHFPTRSSVTHWLENQLALVEQERSLHSA